MKERYTVMSQRGTVSSVTEVNPLMERRDAERIAAELAARYPDGFFFVMEAIEEYSAEVTVNGRPVE